MNKNVINLGLTTQTIEKKIMLIGFLNNINRYKYEITPDTQRYSKIF